MRWIKEQYELGDTKIETKFLWFPVEIKGETRWLETVTIEYICRLYWSGAFAYWHESRFIDNGN